MAELKNFDKKEEYKKVQEKITDTLKQRGVDIEPDELDELFEVWNDLIEIDPSVSLSKDKYTLMQDIANMPDNIDVSQKLEKAKERYTEIYEQQQEEFGKEVTLYGVSGFFEI